jgi:hypothetical protein
LNVSLMWIEIAQRGQRLSMSIALNVRKYRIWLVVYYSTLGVAIIVFAIIDTPLYAVIVMIPALIFISVTYAIGYRRIRDLLSDEQEKYRPILSAISITAYTIVGISIFVILLSFILIGIIFAINSGTIAITPLFNPVNLIFLSIFAAGAVANLVVLLYCGGGLFWNNHSVGMSSPQSGWRKEPNGSKREHAGSKKEPNAVAVHQETS